MSKEDKRKIPAEKPIKDIAKKKIPPSDREYIEKMQRPAPWPDPPPEKQSDNKEKE